MQAKLSLSRGIAQSGRTLGFDTPERIYSPELDMKRIFFRNVLPNYVNAVSFSYFVTCRMQKRYSTE
jgi:hypothetical protein